MIWQDFIRSQTSAPESMKPDVYLKKKRVASCCARQIVTDVYIAEKGWGGMPDRAAAAAIRTPWGETDRLRERQLRPGPGAARETVARNQRERLFAAMVASTATSGYPATTVADLLALAGVSRATFYKHFRDKADCFQATVDAVLDAGLALIRNRLEGPAPPCRRVAQALEGVLRLVADQPAAARMSLVESYLAGNAGLDPVNRAFELACKLTHGALRQMPDHEHTPPELARAVIGGLHRVLYTHLYRGQETALLGGCDELACWATGYPSAQQTPSRRRRSRRSAGAPPIIRIHDPHERIIRAFATAVAARGFPDSSVAQITAAAEISNSTFYQHFENKEDAMMAALDLSGAQLVAAVLPRARRAPEWPHAVCRALEAVCGFLASERDLARLRAVEVYAAGPEAILHRDRAWEQIVEELIPGGIREGSSSLALEASSGAVYALVYEKVRRDEFEKLTELPPLLGYLMLTPLLGAEHANEIVIDGLSGPRSAWSR
jgi:AcrR family transcriptional regulator